MNVRFDLHEVWKTVQGIGSISSCLVFLAIAAVPARPAAAETSPQTTLAVTASNEGPRTRFTLKAHVPSPDQGGVSEGVVNFRSGDTDLGSAAVNAEGEASVQTDILPAGDHPVTATYQDQASGKTSVSKPQQVHAYVSTVAGFTIAATPTTLSTAVGGFVSSIMTVTPNNGFNGYVSLSCSGLPVNTTCTFTPVSVAAICTSASACPSTTSVMQIQTQAPSPKDTTASKSSAATLAKFAFVLPVIFGLAGFRARNRAWRNASLAMLAFVGVMGMTACSQRYRYLNHGPPDNPGTPEGTYTVTVQSESSAGSVTTVPPTAPSLTLTITAPKS